MRKRGLITATIGAGILASGAVAHAQFFNLATTFNGTNMTAGIMTDTADVTSNAYVFDQNSTTVTASPAANLALGSVNIKLLDLTPTLPTGFIPANNTTDTFSTSFTISYTLTNTNSAGTANNGTASGALTGLLGGTMVHTTTGLDSVTFSVLSPTLGSQVTLTAGGSLYILNFLNVQNPGPVANTTGATGTDAIINAKVTTGGLAVSTPEPGATAMLIGMGLSGGLFAYRRRRRRA